MTVELDTSRVESLSRERLTLSLELVQKVSTGHWSLELLLEHLLFGVAIYGNDIYVAVLECDDCLVDHLACRVTIQVIELNRDTIFQLLTTYATDHSAID